jgi:flagellar hook-associated protein 3 FlgL
MRISTPQMNYNSMEGVRKHAEDLYGIQQKLSSGQRVSTPGDDPVAASRIYRIDKVIKQMNQYNANADFAKTRLNLEDSTLTDFTDVTQRIRELGILGMSDTQNTDGRKAIATEMRSLLENLKSIANTQDSNGEFILSGDKTDKAPYQQVTSANVTTLSTGLTAPQPTNYFTVGDGVTPVTINKLDGSTVVMNGVGPNPAIPAANQIVDNFNGKMYTLNAVTNGYEDSAGQPVFAYNGSHNGSRFVQIAPDDDNQDPGNDTGDASRVRVSDQGARTFGNYSKTSTTPWAPTYAQLKNPQLNYNIFDTVREMANQLDTGVNGTPNIGANATKMDELMAELDTSMKAVSDVHTDVGTRLQRIDMQYDMNQDFKGGLTENLSKLRDQDMVTGISDYQKTLSGLQMAQLTYSKISELSLFNYLR